MLTLTDAQKSALKWLKNRGADGVLDRTNCVIARGERAGVMRSTWTALERDGCVERYGKRRIKVTTQGQGVDVSQVQEADCA